LSEGSEDEQKKAESSQQQQEQSGQKSAELISSENKNEQGQKPKTAPRVGTPIGTPIGKPIGMPVARPASTPAVSEPVGAPPTVGTARPTVGTPVGAARPAVGTTVARPATAPPTQTGPTTPKLPSSKPQESKVEISRRNFIKALAIFGGIAAVASYVPIASGFLQGSVGAGSAAPDLVLVQNPNLPNNQLVPIKPSDVDPANGTIFQYPYVVGDSNVNSDSFVQCVLIQLPTGFSGEGYSVQDPTTGKNYIAFSRVCVHLWCLWSYNINDPRGPVGACPCHGSTYVPGSGNYPESPSFSNQPPGMAVAGPASLQTAPNNMLPIIQLKIENGVFHAVGKVGQVGCGQKC
jgi:rieske iron-sulfur protein